MRWLCARWDSAEQQRGGGWSGARCSRICFYKILKNSTTLFKLVQARSDLYSNVIQLLVGVFVFKKFLFFFIILYAVTARWFELFPGDAGVLGTYAARGVNCPSWSAPGFLLLVCFRDKQPSFPVKVAGVFRRSPSQRRRDAGLRTGKTAQAEGGWKEVGGGGLGAARLNRTALPSRGCQPRPQMTNLRERNKVLLSSFLL